METNKEITSTNIQDKENRVPIFSLSKITDPRGNLTVAEQWKDVPFAIRRVYWTYDIPAGESRGGHAHKH